MKRHFGSRRGLGTGISAEMKWLGLALALAGLAFSWILFSTWKEERDRIDSIRMAEAEVQMEIERKEEIKRYEAKKEEDEKKAEAKRIEILKEEEIARLDAAKIVAEKIAKADCLIKAEVRKAEIAKADAAKALLEVLAEKDRIKARGVELDKEKETRKAKLSELEELESDLQPEEPPLPVQPAVYKPPTRQKEVFRTYYPLSSICGKCRGTGKCTWPECSGGMIAVRHSHNGRHRRQVRETCWECHGTDKCSRCGGSGIK